MVEYVNGTIKESICAANYLIKTTHGHVDSVLTFKVLFTLYLWLKSY